MAAASTLSMGRADKQWPGTSQQGGLAPMGTAARSQPPGGHTGTRRHTRQDRCSDELASCAQDGTESHRNYEYLMAKTYTRRFPVVYPPGTASACVATRRAGLVGVAGGAATRWFRGRDPPVRGRWGGRGYMRAMGLAAGWPQACAQHLPVLACLSQLLSRSAFKRSLWLT